MNASEKKGPYARMRVGRFQIALFNVERRRRDNNGTEHSWTTDRACIRYSWKVSGEERYETTELWCYSDELRDLVAVLDECNQLPEIHPRAPTREGATSSPGG